MLNNLEVVQISNHVYCDSKLNQMDIENRLLPNPYYDYPYLIISDFFNENECNVVNQFIKEDSEFKTAKLRTKNSESILDKVVDKKFFQVNNWLFLSLKLLFLFIFIFGSSIHYLVMIDTVLL